MFYNRPYMKAGIRQVKDMVYEYVRGFLPNRAIYDCIVGWDEDIESQKWTVYVKASKQVCPGVG